MTAHKKMIGFHIPVDLHEAIKELAYQHRTSMAQVVTTAIDTYLKDGVYTTHRKKATGFIVPGDLHEAVKAFASQHNTSMSRIVIASIQDYVEKNGGAR